MDPLAGTDEVRYKSPKEIALENAAESLGAELGEYYPQDWEIPDGRPEAGKVPDRVRASGDAAREEILVYVERVRTRRRLRRTARQKRLAVLALLIAVIVSAPIVLALLLAKDPPEQGRPGLDRFQTELDRGASLRRPILDMGPDIVLTMRIPGTHSEIFGTVDVHPDGRICSGVSDRRDGLVKTAGMGCGGGICLATRVAGGCAAVNKVDQFGDHIVMLGVAHQQVVKIVGRTLVGREPLRVKLSRVFTPKLPSAGPGRPDGMRVFMAIGPYDGDGPSDFVSGPPYTDGLIAWAASGRPSFIGGAPLSEQAVSQGC